MPNNKDAAKESYNQSEGGAAQTDLPNTMTFEEELKKFFRKLNARETSSPAELEKLRREIDRRLTGERAVTVAFPECADVLLSLINTSGTDEITNHFKNYFDFRRHSVIAPLKRPEGESESVTDLGMILDDGLEECTKSAGTVFPPVWCLPANCVTLRGDRRVYNDGTEKFIRRLFMADLVWLFFFDRMGIFKILGSILDDFAIKGNFPISNNSGDSTHKDDLISIILEAMTRKTKTGLSSTVRDRNISYRRSLGWILEEGRKLNLDTVVNTAFTNLFHKFIQTSLEYYKDKRLATAIQGSTNVNRVSVATLTSIKDTIDLLKRTFDSFKYGRVYSNTLSGIVWVVAGMSLIREMRTTLGISSEYDEPVEFIPAAYNLLVAKTSATANETNRYDVHRDCAENARDILLDLEVVRYQDTLPNGELEHWLDLAESKIEGYRTAYRSLTGIDLGEAGTPRIEQQV